MCFCVCMFAYDMKVFQTSTFFAQFRTKSINLCNDFQQMFDSPLESHRGKLGIILVCFVNRRLQTKFFVKVLASECICPIKMKWNQWKWLTRAHSCHTAHSAAHPRQTKKQEVWQTTEMVIIKPQFYMRFKSICSFEFFFLCHYFWFAVETKVVRDKVSETSRERWKVDQLQLMFGWLLAFTQKPSIHLCTSMAWILI